MIDIDDKIHVGDFLPLVNDVPDRTFDIIISDPPYNIGKDFGNDSDKMNMGDYLDLSKKWIEEANG